MWDLKSFRKKKEHCSECGKKLNPSELETIKEDHVDENVCFDCYESMD